MTKCKRPDHIDVWYDTQDPRTPGWAYRAYYFRPGGTRTADPIKHEESGPLPSTRREVSARTLTRHARKAVGCPRTRVPVVIAK